MTASQNQVMWWCKARIVSILQVQSGCGFHLLLRSLQYIDHHICSEQAQYDTGYFTENVWIILQVMMITDFSIRLGCHLNIRITSQIVPNPSHAILLILTLYNVVRKKQFLNKGGRKSVVTCLSGVLALCWLRLEKPYKHQGSQKPAYFLLLGYFPLSRYCFRQQWRSGHGGGDGSPLQSV